MAPVIVCQAGDEARAAYVLGIVEGHGRILAAGMDGLRRLTPDDWQTFAAQHPTEARAWVQWLLATLHGGFATVYAAATATGELG